MIRLSLMAEHSDSCSGRVGTLAVGAGSRTGSDSGSRTGSDSGSRTGSGDSGAARV